MTSWICPFCKQFNYRLMHPTRCKRCRKPRPGRWNK